MTVTKFSARVKNGVVNCKWDATELHSFLYQDAELIFSSEAGITEYSGAYVTGAVYNAVDSATASPAAELINPVPFRYITLTWDEQATAVKYRVDVDDLKKFITAGNPSYTFKTARLESGTRTLGVLAIDAAGNELPIKNLYYEIEDVPPPVRSISISQSGAGNITLTIVEPLGWPT